MRSLLVATLAAVLVAAQTDGSSPGPEYIRIDDMLFLPEQLAVGGERSHAHANPTNPAGRFGTWYAGVIPFQLDAAFSASERGLIATAFATWSRVAPLRFVERTTQTGYLNVTRDDETGNASNCFSTVGFSFAGQVVRTNIGPGCFSQRTVTHEFGHALGLFHEHQRADRDAYLQIDFSNVRSGAESNFRLLATLPTVGEYDFESVMHYRANTFAADASRPTLIPLEPYARFATVMGTLTEPSVRDHDVLATVYNAKFRDNTVRTATLPPQLGFDRGEFLIVLEWLHAFYMSRYGLQRPSGLSIDGRPDFAGIAQWIFGLYLPARTSGFDVTPAFDLVVAEITASEEWRQKNPTRSPLARVSFTPRVTIAVDEYLGVMQQLDAFYSSSNGLQRPDGLSIAGGPDFLGIATWVFDIYLNERLRGISPGAAWLLTENAIRATDEWRSKH
jgi:hypothetical protein